MKNNFFRVNSGFAGKREEKQESPANRGLLIGTGIGAALYIFTGSMTAVVAGLFLGLMLGTAGKRN